MKAKNIRDILANNIRYQAKVKKIPLNSLADFAGVSRSQLYDVLASKKAPTIDWLEKIAKALETTSSKLLAQ